MYTYIYIDILSHTYQNGVSRNTGRFARDILLLFPFAQSQHFSNVIPRAPEGGGRISWKNPGVTITPRGDLNNRSRAPPVCEHDQPFTNSVHETFTNTERSQINHRHRKPFTNRSRTVHESFTSRVVVPLNTA